MTASPPTRPSWTAAAAVSLFSGLWLGVVAVNVGGGGPGSPPAAVESDDGEFGAEAGDRRSPAPSSALRLDEPIGLFAGLGLAWARSDDDPAAGTAVPAATGVRAMDRATTGPSTAAGRPERSRPAAGTTGPGTPASPDARDEAPPIAPSPTVAVPTAPAPGRTASPATAGATPPARDASSRTSPATTAPRRTAPPRTSPATSPPTTTAPGTTAPAPTTPPTTVAAPAPTTTAPTVPPSTSPAQDDDERGNRGGRSQDAHDRRDDRRSERDDDDEDDD